MPREIITEIIIVVERIRFANIKFSSAVGAN